MTADEMRKEIRTTFGTGSSWDMQIRNVSDNLVPILFDVMMDSKKTASEKRN